MRSNRHTSTRFLPQALHATHGRDSNDRSIASTNNATHWLDVDPQPTVLQLCATHTFSAITYSLRYGRRILIVASTYVGTPAHDIQRGSTGLPPTPVVLTGTIGCSWRERDELPHCPKRLQRELRVGS